MLSTITATGGRPQGRGDKGPNFIDGGDQAGVGVPMRISNRMSVCMSEIPPISDMEICMSENPVYSSIRLVYGDSDEILQWNGCHDECLAHHGDVTALPTTAKMMLASLSLLDFPKVVFPILEGIITHPYMCSRPPVLGGAMRTQRVSSSIPEVRMA